MIYLIIIILYYLFGRKGEDLFMTVYIGLQQIDILANIPRYK